MATANIDDGYCRAFVRSLPILCHLQRNERRQMGSLLFLLLMSRVCVWQCHLLDAHTHTHTFSTFVLSM